MVCRSVLVMCRSVLVVCRSMLVLCRPVLHVPLNLRLPLQQEVILMCRTLSSIAATSRKQTAGQRRVQEAAAVAPEAPTDAAAPSVAALNPQNLPEKIFKTPSCPQAPPKPASEPLREPRPLADKASAGRLMFLSGASLEGGEGDDEAYDEGYGSHAVAMQNSRHEALPLMEPPPPPLAIGDRGVTHASGGAAVSIGPDCTEPATGGAATDGADVAETPPGAEETSVRGPPQVGANPVARATSNGAGPSGVELTDRARGATGDATGKQQGSSRDAARTLEPELAAAPLGGYGMHPGGAAGTPGMDEALRTWQLPPLSQVRHQSQ